MFPVVNNPLNFGFCFDNPNFWLIASTTLNPASPPAAHDKLISARAVGVAIDGIDQILTVSADTGTNEGITLGSETLNFAGTANETIGFQDNTIDHAMLQTYRWDSADLFGKLQLYRQLIFEFGWPSFQATFASYYSDDYPVSQYGEFMDGFAIRYSAIVERDLVDFFNHWEYPMSTEAATTIQGFGDESWLPPGW